jgi:hypothetical protein
MGSMLTTYFRLPRYNATTNEIDRQYFSVPLFVHISIRESYCAT